MCQKLIQQLIIEMSVFLWLVEGIRTINGLLGAIDEPVFVALLLLCHDFLADFAEYFFFDEGRLAVGICRLNVLFNLFVLSFWVFLYLLIRWHAIVEDQSFLFIIRLNALSFAANFIVLLQTG